MAASSRSLFRSHRSRPRGRRKARSLVSKIAIVDDHFLFAEALAGAVREIADHEVCGIAVTGAQAVSLVRDQQPDIVLLDYHLPGYKGEDLIARIRSASPRSGIIVLTSDTTETARTRAAEAGASAFLTKDRALEDVVQALREAVAQLEQPAGTQPAAGLSARELEVLGLVDQGKDPTTIAYDLGLSVHTVRTHVQNILTKLEARSQIEALAIARRRGLIR